ncbi:MAG: extracellular solute-binding protein, partial [Calditrichia bacterium]
MKNLKKICVAVLCSLVVANMSCSSSNDTSNAAKIVYWTAPSVEVTEFETEIVAEWNSTHPDIQIDWKTIPAGRSSEEVILTAIATKTGPDICSNIFGGFAAQLADAKVIVALDTLPGFWEVVEKRKMTDIINKNWFYKG